MNNKQYLSRNVIDTPGTAYCPHCFAPQAQVNSDEEGYYDERFICTNCNKPFLAKCDPEVEVSFYFTTVKIELSEEEKIEIENRKPLPGQLSLFGEEVEQEKG